MTETIDEQAGPNPWKLTISRGLLGDDQILVTILSPKGVKKAFVIIPAKALQAAVNKVMSQ